MTPHDTTRDAELRTERLCVALTASEKAALARIAALFPEKYSGTSVAIRDYTPAEAVAFVERLRVTMDAS